MNYLFYTLGCTLLLFIIFLIANKPFRKQLWIKLKGRSDEIMRKDATTPEGAADYYNTAIRDKEDFYNRASATLAEISGKLDKSEKDLYLSQKELMKIDKEINRCLDANNESDAMSYALKKSTLESKVEVLKQTILDLKESKEHQKDLRDQAAMDLTALKEEKERTIYQLEADQQIIQIHQSMDSLATNNESERMLERVREGANKTRERANGSKIAYETSAEANDRRLGKSTREREAQELLEKMKRQRKG
ncbi:MAG: hypothetical protein KH031_24035 [Clostridiales bacterium]|nr:hypothetical protein [Clostridiales bacterium]